MSWIQTFLRRLENQYFMVFMLPAPDTGFDLTTFDPSTDSKMQFSAACKYTYIQKVHKILLMS